MDVLESQQAGNREASACGAARGSFRSQHSSMRARLSLLLLSLVWLGSLQGCATYSDKTQVARELASRGDYNGAVSALDEMLGVDDPHAHPENFRHDRALVLLERAMLHQANADFEGSRDDLLVADKQLELLDFTNTAATDIARYFYSDSASPYKISPIERLTLNALNILNYLAAGDLSGARVEAKRFTVMRKFLQDTDPDHAHGSIGSYLAGFVHEQLGEFGPALRHYDEALDEGRLPGLESAVVRLALRDSYRGRNVKKLLESGVAPARDGGGEILVVAGVGRVPFKIPKRLPIGAAIGLLNADFTGDLDVLSRSAFKVLIFPELVPAVGTYSSANASIDGAPIGMDRVTNLGTELVREYEQIKPKIIAAAVTRMISRAVVAEGARVAGREIAGNDGGAALVGLLASLVAESVLVAADKPDTRSWTLLPEQIFVSRHRVTAGTYDVEVGLGDSPTGAQQFSVDVPEGGYALIVLMPLH